MKWIPGSLYRRDLEFMRRYRQSVRETPEVPPDHVVRQRLRWQIEEMFELLEACFWKPVSSKNVSIYQAELNALSYRLMRLIRDAPLAVDLVAYADANADIRYISYGNDIAAGIYSPEIDEEVARSNDTKEPPAEDEGKVRKGADYSPPDIARILRKQGWTG